MTANFSRQGNHFILSSALLREPLTVDDFDYEALARAGRVDSQAEGRGSAWFIRVEEEHAVLRHYFRGGLMAKLSRDRFLWQGVERSRVFAEYRLLEWMTEQGLPVPMPLGARLQRLGLHYRCDLITRALPNTRTLADRLAEQPLDSATWMEVGRVVRQMHSLGVWHSDLNAKNILLDNTDAVSLIDFDRCRRRDGEACSDCGARWISCLDWGNCGILATQTGSYCLTATKGSKASV